MRTVLALLVPALLLAAPVAAQEVPAPAPVFSLDLGPGFLTPADSTFDASQAEAFLAVAYNLGPKLALGVRVDAQNEDGQEKLSGTWWAFARGYLTGLEGGTRTYLALLVSLESDVSVRGGVEQPLNPDLSLFGEAEGRRLDDTASWDLGLAAGLRVGFGQR